MHVVLPHRVVLSPGVHGMSSGINVKAISRLRSALTKLENQSDLLYTVHAPVLGNKCGWRQALYSSKLLEGSKTACRNISRRAFTWLGSVPWCSPYLHGRARLGMLPLVSCPTTRQAWMLTCLEFWGNCHRLGEARAALLAVTAQVLLLGRDQAYTKHLLLCPEG